MRPFLHQLRFRRDHRWTPPHLSAYLDLDLSAWARARVRRHTAACAECRTLLDDLRHMLALLQSAPEPEPLADVPAIASAVVRRLYDPVEP
jgi:anti-sigma factor RsiW